jgi:FkbM family methyltransferase
LFGNRNDPIQNHKRKRINHPAVLSQPSLERRIDGKTILKRYDWRFLANRYIIGRKWAYGYKWTWNTILSDAEEFNEPIICQKGTDLIDCGACFGMWTIRAAKYYHRVFAIEPFPPNYHELTCNIKLNHTKNVCPIKIAIGAENGETTLFTYGDDNRGEPSAVKEHMGHYAKGAVATRIATIDSLVEKYGIEPSLIKLDVEGAEAQALQGARRTVAGYKPKLVVEVHAPITIQDVQNAIGEKYSWNIRWRYLNQSIYPYEKQPHLLGTPE